MRLPDSADACLRRYARLRDSLSSPTTPSMSTGMQPMPHCTKAACAGIRVWDTKEHRHQCSKCERPWLFVPAADFNTDGSGGGRDDRLAELAALQRIIERPKLWERRAWYLYVVGNVGDVRDVAKISAGLWPRAPHIWTPRRTHELIKAARETVEAHLRWIERGGTERWPNSS